MSNNADNFENNNIEFKPPVIGVFLLLIPTMCLIYTVIGIIIHFLIHHLHLF